MDEFKHKSIEYMHDPGDEFQSKDSKKQWGRRAARRSSKHIGFDLWDEHVFWMNEQFETEFDIVYGDFYDQVWEKAMLGEIDFPEGVKIIY